ncbi:uncharacterized protein LOC127792987 isoform X2 [Diospyros lotus]|nr:uncharacterized protein LOC127792987 isoform X2 [Diospyros lotus]
MVQKRPLSDNESYDTSTKHPRQQECSNQLVSFLGFVPVENKTQLPMISGEGKANCTESDEKLVGGIITKLPLSSNDEEISVPGCISNMSWDCSTTSEEEDELEAPFHLLLSPEYYNADRPTRALVQSEDICTSLEEYPPQKIVPIGPGFQADIPTWGAQSAKDASVGSDGSGPSILISQTSGYNLSDCKDLDLENRLAGSCVIPMPESEQSPCNSDNVGVGRTDCSCEDCGSVRCVRQHIREGRENLLRTLGRETFLELGFSDMGEVVADKWSEEEELLFHQVVFSNPASLGRNFWDHLPMVFPSRAKRDIVSYYFNVFMLRRRAVQNRCDPMHIDSDDDEWQGIDDYGDDEVRAAEEDEDSAVESPATQDAPSHTEFRENSHQFHVSVPSAGFSNNAQGPINIASICSRKLLNDCGPDSRLQLSGKCLWDEKEDLDVQEDSCTSSDAGSVPLATHVKDDNSNNSMSGGNSHGFVMEHYNVKEWDIGYLNCPKRGVELLPTCSMIEEVFGSGASEYVGKDGEGLS